MVSRLSPRAWRAGGSGREAPCPQCLAAGAGQPVQGIERCRYGRRRARTRAGPCGRRVIGRARVDAAARHLMRQPARRALAARRPCRRARRARHQRAGRRPADSGSGRGAGRGRRRRHPGTSRPRPALRENTRMAEARSAGATGLGGARDGTRRRPRPTGLQRRPGRLATAHQGPPRAFHQPGARGGGGRPGGPDLAEAPVEVADPGLGHDATTVTSGVDRAVGADRGPGTAGAHQPAVRGCRSASSASMPASQESTSLTRNRSSRPTRKPRGPRPWLRRS
jgi:hypothetical protein